MRHYDYDSELDQYQDTETDNRPPRRVKDTSRWCKGKPGKAHTPQIRRSHHYQDEQRWTCGPGYRGWVCYHESICSGCGKILKTFLDGTDCPDAGTTV